jgi:hypothetical protein
MWVGNPLQRMLAELPVIDIEKAFLSFSSAALAAIFRFA